jgi:hypothetical protein
MEYLLKHDGSNLVAIPFDESQAVNIDKLLKSVRVCKGRPLQGTIGKYVTTYAYKGEMRHVISCGRLKWRLALEQLNDGKYRPLPKPDDSNHEAVIKFEEAIQNNIFLENVTLYVIAKETGDSNIFISNQDKSLFMMTNIYPDDGRICTPPMDVTVSTSPETIVTMLENSVGNTDLVMEDIEIEERYGDFFYKKQNSTGLLNPEAANINF